MALVLWVDNDDKDTDVNIIIRNNSNGIRLFECTQWYYPPKTGCIRYISRSKMTMEDYCGDDELELYISSVSYDHQFKPPLYSQPRGDAVLNDPSMPPLYALRNGQSFEPAPIKECGVHVIAGKSDSFEELAVGRDAVMPSPPLYHLLPHPHCGSITASTPKQWIDFLFAKLQNHNLSLTLWGKNTYFI